MPRDYSDAHKLDRAGILTKELARSYNKTLRMGKIPMDVMHVLTPEQFTVIATERLAVCKEFQLQLEDFYKKHYQKVETRHGDGEYTPMQLANISLSHDGNRTLWYVEHMLKEGKPSQAAVHIDELPSKFGEIYNLYMGKTDVDIKPYFPEVFATNVNDTP